MTYSLGIELAGKELTSPSPDSEASARWFLVTPDIARAFRDDPALGLLLGGSSGAQYMGISRSGTTLYVRTATGGGSSSGTRKLSVPAGAEIIPYAFMMQALAPAVQRASAPAGTGSRLPLYIGLGVGGLVLAGGLVYLMTRKPAPMAANKRRVRRNSSFGPERDRAAAQARDAFARGDSAGARRALARLSEIDLALMPRAIRKNSSYAIPERRAYPITSALDAYHATQRLKQGRVRSEADAKRIISAIKHQHPGVWREHLAGYPVSKIIASRRKGLAARHRS